MASPQLAVLIGTLIPGLAEIAFLLATVATLRGVAPELTDALGVSIAGTPLQRLQAYQKIGQLLLPFLTTPVAVQAIEAQGANPTQVQATAQFGLTSAITAEVAPQSFPFLDTQEEVSAYQETAAELLAEGSITAGAFAAIQSLLQRESDRLKVGITPAGFTQYPGLLQTYLHVPTFPTASLARSFLEGAETFRRQGVITNEGYLRVATNVQEQIDALLAAEAGAAVVTPPVTKPAEVVTPPAVVPATGVAGATGGAITATVAPEVTQAIQQAISTLQATLAELVAEGKATEGQLEQINAHLSATATALAVPAPTTVNIPGLSTVLQGVLAALTGTGAGSLAAALTSAATGSAEERAHLTQQGQNRSQGSWVGPLLGYFRQAAPELLLGAGLLFDSPLKELLTKEGEKIFDALSQPSGLVAEDLEANAETNASARFLQALGLGMEAQVLAYSLESLTSIKYLGLNQVAGALGDFAGFKRISDGVIGTVEDAAIYQPLRWRARRRFRSTLPSEGLLETLYAKYAIPFATLQDVLARQGLPDEIIDRLPEVIYRDPEVGEITRLYQLHYVEAGGQPDSDSRAALDQAGIPVDQDWYIKSRLAKARLSRLNIEAFTRVVQLGAVRREQFLRYNQIATSYREGFWSRERAHAEILAALSPAPPADYRLAAMDLQREYALASDTRDLVLSAVKKGVITPEQASTQLAALGMEGERVRVDVLRAQIGLLPPGRVDTSGTTDISGGLTT